MPSKMKVAHRLPIILSSVVAWFLAYSPLARGAAIIWNGPLVTFSKPALADFTLPQFQDRMTDAVWITRATTQGLFNIKSEPAYTHNLSPSGTEWAFGTTANFASLTYKAWELWATTDRPDPPSTVGKDAVLHLIAEDIYLDIKFTFWGGSGGAYSYIRSSAPVPEPGSFATLCVAGLLGLRRRR